VRAAQRVIRVEHHHREAGVDRIGVHHVNSVLRMTAAAGDMLNGDTNKLGC
jgi:hypothetical protein